MVLNKCTVDFEVDDDLNNVDALNDDYRDFVVVGDDDDDDIVEALMSLFVNKLVFAADEWHLLAAIFQV